MSKRTDRPNGVAIDSGKVAEVLQTETGGRAATGPAAVILFHCSSALVPVSALDCITAPRSF